MAQKSAESSASAYINLSFVHATATFLVLLITVVFLSWRLRKGGRKYPKNVPPVVEVPKEELFKKPREAYEWAVRQHGSVIGVKRKGRLEYIVDETLTHDVLTLHTTFSFEKGTAYVLNLHYFNNIFATFFVYLDDLVQRMIVRRLPLIVEKVFPVFLKHGDRLKCATATESGTKQERYVSAEEYVHASISEAMTQIILGPEFADMTNLKVIEKVANGLAVVTGIYQNTSWWGTEFPDAWRLFTWAKILCTTIPLFYATIGLQVWSKIRPEWYDVEEAKVTPELYNGTVLQYLACKHANPDSGKVSFVGYLRITALLLGIFFASVHQTSSVAVWIIYELALRSEYIPALREELFENVEVDQETGELHSSYDSLQRASRLDSFIREVLRTKGDTLSVCRMTTTDISIAGYTIPEGFLVIPLASLSHLSKQYHGHDAEMFNGKRWIGTGKQAIMVNHTYFPFGLGRWACPGRALAVAEIKMIVWSIIYRATPMLKDNRYTVLDPLNVTSVAPKGELTLAPT